MVDVLRCSTRSRTGVAGSVPAGTRSGISAAVPSDSRVTTTRPSSSASRVHGRSTRGPRRSRTARPRARPRRPPSAGPAQLEPRPAEHQRPPVLVLERLRGIDPPADADVPRAPPPGHLDRPGHGHDRGGGEDPPDPGPGSEPPHERASRRRARQGRRGRGRGGSRRDDSRREPASGRRLRRGINGPKEPTRRVGLDVIAAVSIAQPLRAAINATRPRGAGQRTYPPFSARSRVELVHRVSTTAASARARPADAAERSARAAPVSGSSARTWPAKLVRTRRPPTSSAAVTTSEWATRHATSPSASQRERLDLGLEQDVRQPRRAEDHHDRRRRAVAPAQRRRSAPRTRRRGSRTRPPAGPRCPRARPAGSSLIVDARRTVHGPAGVSTRSSARHRRSGSGPDSSPRSASGPAGLGQREDGRALAAARPAAAWRGARPGTRRPRAAVRRSSGWRRSGAGVLRHGGRAVEPGALGQDVGLAALLADRRDVRVGQHPQRGRRHREHRGRRCRRRPTPPGTARGPGP